MGVKRQGWQWVAEGEPLRRVAVVRLRRPTATHRQNADRLGVNGYTMLRAVT